MAKAARMAGRYEALSLLGRGGMATVHLGLDHAQSPPARIVLKRMHPAYAAMPTMIESLEEEARIVSSLDHPNIVPVYDCVRDEKGLPNLVMELVEGLDLSRYLALATPSQRPWHEAAYIAREVLEALRAAHEHDAPIFHRDVTPGNVLLDVRGAVRLTDFGLARAMDRQTMTSPGVLKGRIAYLAPELIAGKRAGARTDLFAVGIILWEMLAGRRLYEASTELALFVRAGRAAIPPIDTLRGDLPEALVQILARTIDRVPEQRYASAREAASALDALLRGEREPFSAKALASRVVLAKRLSDASA